MKKIFIINTLFFFVLQLIPAQETFQKTIKGIGECYQVKVTSDKGYIMVGHSYVGPGPRTMSLIKTDSVFNIEWSKYYGGDNIDYGYSVVETADNGFLAVGQTASFGAGAYDVYIVRTDNNGDTLWTKAVGGTGSDDARSITIIDDNKYIIAGETRSYGDGSRNGYLIKIDDSGNILWAKSYGENEYETFKSCKTDGNNILLSGYTREGGTSGFNCWFMVCDTAGIPVFSKVIGGDGEDYGYDVIPTSNNGYILAGKTSSFSAELDDIYVVSFDAAGDTIWTRKYGGAGYEFLANVIEAQDSNIIITGMTKSAGMGLNDVLVMKIDTEGNILWTKAHGGNDDEGVKASTIDKDGNIIALGNTQSFGGVLMLKMNNIGNSLSCQQKEIQFTNTSTSSAISDFTPSIISGYIDSCTTSETDSIYAYYTDIECEDENYTYFNTIGDAESECFYESIITSDGRIVSIGYTNSYGSGGNDIYIVKCEPNGEIIWSKTLGGINDESGLSIIEDISGKYVITGYTSTFGNGGAEMFLAKIDNKGELEFFYTYGGTSADGGERLIQTMDRGYIIAGYTQSYGITTNQNIYLLKTDEDGNELWNKVFSGTDYEHAYNIKELKNDNGIIILSKTNSFGNGTYELLITKTDNLGNIDWSKSYGTGVNTLTEAYSIIEPAEGGFVVVGCQSGYSNGSADVMLLKLDKNGNVIWNKAYGGSSSDYGKSITQTFDGGYIICGYTRSFDAQSNDIYLIKVDQIGTVEWSRIIGGSLSDYAYDIIETISGDYIISGCCNDFGDTQQQAFLIRTNNEGYYGACHSNEIESLDSSAIFTITNAVLTVDNGNITTSPVVSQSFQNSLNNNANIQTTFQNTNVKCFSGNNGSINLTVDGGIEPLEFNWSNGSNNEDINTLQAGTYYLTITDNANCEKTDSVEITQPSLLNSQITKTDISCFGVADGTANTITTGGTPPYSYYWNTGQTDSILTNLFPGMYYVNVFDLNGCLASNNILITEPSSIELVHNSTFTTCGNSIGQIMVNTSGGTPPYTFDWSNGGADSLITTLSEGRYTLTVTDTNNCIKIEDFEVEQSALSVPICIVTVDTSSGKNQIVWEKTTDQAIEYYNIYKQSYDGSFDYLASQPYDELSYIVDGTSEPEVRANRYKISVVDTCGNESELSENHKTLHLNVSKNAVGDGFALTWGHYEGFSFNTYIIYRGSTASGLQAIDSIAYDISSFTYTDISALNDQTYFYRVAAVKPNETCLATKASNGPFSRSLSNLEDNRQQSSGIQYPVSGIQLKIFPNPMSSFTTIELPNDNIYQLNILDLTGKIIRMENNISGTIHKLERANLETGMYIIELKGEKTYKSKLIVE